MVSIMYSQGPFVLAKDPVYVIITNYESTSDYYLAIEKLAEYRNATIIIFEKNITNTLEDLRAIMPEYVAVIVSPEVINQTFTHQVFNLSRYLVVDDPISLAHYRNDEERVWVDDCNFAYGFITGESPADLMTYVDGLIQYETDWRTINRNFLGMKNGYQGHSFLEDLNTTSTLLAKKGWNCSTIALEEDYGTTNYYVSTDYWKDHQKKYAKTISESDYAYFVGHGSPQHMLGPGCIEEGVAPTSFHVKYLLDVPRTPYFVINIGCHGACISTQYTTSYKWQYVENITESLPLVLLKKGTLAYVGHIQVWGWMAWPGIISSETIKNPGKPIGKIIQHEWLNAQDTVGSELWVAVSNGGIILYGDPMLSLYPGDPPESLFSYNLTHNHPKWIIDLDASESIDNDGEIVQYNWTSSTNPTTISSASPQFQVNVTLLDQVTITLTTIDNEHLHTTTHKIIELKQPTPVKDSDSTEEPETQSKNDNSHRKLTHYLLLAVLASTTLIGSAYLIKNLFK